MGVQSLWPIFDEYEVCELYELADLRGKKVAVDLSGWVMQSKTCPGLNRSKKPHLKTLFYRLCTLLTKGILPVFVKEGKPPDLKGCAIKKRLKQPNPASGSEVSRSSFDMLLSECQELLDCLGVPCVKSQGEAESLCAFLDSQGVVDGCITEDNDAFLYGAKTVFRGFSTVNSKESAQLRAYCIENMQRKMKLDRHKLIALALLLGCDYASGVQGIGKETALKLLSELEGTDILQRFRDWKTKDMGQLFPSLDAKLEVKVPHCTHCGHPGKQKQHQKDGCTFCSSDATCYLQKDKDKCPCEWHKYNSAKEKIKTELKVYNAVKASDSFPCEEVIAEYLSQSNCLPKEDELEWATPDIQSFQVKAYDWFGWSVETVWQKILPLYTSWQMVQLHNGIPETDREFLYSPLRIERIKKELGIKYYRVIWQCNDEVCANYSEPVLTSEDMEIFSKAYPSVVKEFEREIERSKVLKEQKKEAKKNEKKKGAGKCKRGRTAKRRTSGTPERDSRSSSKISHYFTPLSAGCTSSSVREDSDDDHRDSSPDGSSPSKKSLIVASESLS